MILLNRKYGANFGSERELWDSLMAEFDRRKSLLRMPYTLVRSLHGRGVPLAVASPSLRPYVRKFLKAAGLSRYFRAVVCGDDVLRRKPDPATYLLAVRRLRVRPEDCITVEDSETEVISAKRAGMFAIAVPSRYTKKQDFSRADAVLPSPRELIYSEKYAK